QGQAPGDLVGVLDVHAGEETAIVFELSKALAEAWRGAVGISELPRQEIRHALESKLSRLKEQVIKVDPATFNDPAKTEVVLPPHPAYVITPREVVSGKGCGRVVPKRECAYDAHSLNGFARRLKGYVHAEIPHACSVAGGTTAGHVSRIAEAE